MRSYLILLVLLLLLLPQMGRAQWLVASKVDSVFTKHFDSIEKQAGTSKSLSHDDAEFIYVLGFLSGLDEGYIQCYGSVILTQKSFLRYRKWYVAHRSQITWDKLRQGFALMRVPLEAVLSDSSVVESEKRIKALESLRIN